VKVDRATTLVGRDPELDRLLGLVDRAIGGECSVAFVAGEAGAGKTALLDGFARTAQARHAELIVATGDCNAQTGAGDPYLPFREVLALLTGDVDARLAQGRLTQEGAGRLRDFLRLSGQSLVESGPDLVGIFVPGGSLLARLGGKLARRVPWVDRMAGLVERREVRRMVRDGALEQSHIFEQYTNVLRAMSKHRPLVVILDDLQWADAGSVALLFHLARRLGPSRVLLLGAYRPDDVALGRGDERHPLDPVLNEIARYFGDVTVDLGDAQEREGARLTDALIDAQPNRLDSAFRAAVHRHTRGHPLFTLELIRHLQELGALRRDEDGYLVTAGPIDWGTLPPRIEGVIAERVGRLPDGLGRVLDVAAVEGESFTAEVVARAAGKEARDVVRMLGELDQRYRLVTPVGTRRLNGRRESSYAFRHNLVQKYVYASLDPIERSYLHEDVGRALEELHRDRIGAVSVRLARHFEEAGDDARAADYLRKAADRALRAFANAEARRHLEQARNLLDRLHARDADTWAAGLREVHEDLADLLTLASERASARSAYAAALALTPATDRIARARLERKCGRTWEMERVAEAAARFDAANLALGDPLPDRGPTWWEEWTQLQLDRLSSFYYSGDTERLVAHREQIQGLVEAHGNPAQRVALLQTDVMSRLRHERYRLSAGTVEVARACAAAAMELDGPGERNLGRFQLGLCLLWHGDVEAADRELVQVMDQAHRHGDLRLQTMAATYLTFAARMRGDVEQVRSRAATALESAEAGRLDVYIANAHLHLAWVALRDGDHATADDLATGALDDLQRGPVTIPWAAWAALPLIALRVGSGQFADAIEIARAIFGPGQQPLPDDLRSALVTGIDAWDAGDETGAMDALRAAMGPARRHQYA
jgi:hypothetical protein